MAGLRQLGQISDEAILRLMSDTLFVYGTLKRQGPGEPHRLLRGARFVSPATVGGTLYDLGRYPGLVRKARDGQRVFGELEKR